MFELILALLVGVFTGIFTGLIPGIHINLVASAVISFSPVILEYIAPLNTAVFIISMSITHNFLDFIPSTYLAAPNPDTSESVLPAHRLLYQGKAHEAIVFSVFGAFIGLILTCLCFIPLIFIVKGTYPVIEPFIPAILVCVLVLLIFREEKRFVAFIVCLLAGILGIVVLNFKHIQEPLLPLLSGMFGVSGIILSLEETTKIPKQIFEKEFIVEKGKIIKTSICSLISACLTSFLPGLSSSHTTMLASSLAKKVSDKEVLFMNGFVNSASMVLSIIALYAIEKARNGSIVAVAELISPSKEIIIVLVSAVLINTFFSMFLALKLGKLFSIKIQKVNYKKMCYLVLILISLLALGVAGPFGFLILVISTFVGFLPLLLNINRNHLMCALIFPVILYFLL